MARARLRFDFRRQRPLRRHLAFHLSDHAVLQPPENLPATIVLDEPELGLHPYAIVLLAEMVHSVAHHTQVILATQSVSLVNQFTPEEILVLDRPGGVSDIRRLEQAEIAHWLDEYGLGDLWEKNVLGGRPAL